MSAWVTPGEVIEGDYIVEYGSSVDVITESGGMYAFGLRNGEVVNYSATDELAIQ